MNRNYCITSGIVFALVALGHAWRFALDVPVQFGAWSVPQSVSLVGAIAGAALSVWAFRSARAGKPAAVAYT